MIAENYDYNNYKNRALFMNVPSMSMKEFESSLNHLTTKMETSQAKKEVPTDVKSLIHEVHKCNDYVLANKTISFDPINHSIEKFLEAAKWFLPLFQRDKSTQEKMGALIISLWPLSDELENLKKNLQRKIFKRRYGDQVVKIEKSKKSKKEKKNQD